jgi:hypothetical protein
VRGAYIETDASQLAILEVTPESSADFSSTKESVEEARKFALKLDDLRRSKESYDELKMKLQGIEGVPVS